MALSAVSSTIAAMALDREQRQVLGKLVRHGRQLDVPRGLGSPSAIRRKLVRAGVQTGLVEQGLHNQAYGDADSVGWRQARSHYGSVGERLNLDRSIKGFYSEALAELEKDPSMPAWQIAANVQRPAEQYRGRYRERAGEARGLIRAYNRSSPGGGRGGGGRRGAQGQMQVTQPTLSRGQGQEGGGIDVVEMLAQALAQKPQVQSSGVAPPDFAAGPAFPGGYQPVQSSPQIVDDSLDDALLALGTLKGAVPPRSVVTPGQVKSTLTGGKLRSGTGRSVTGSGALFDVQKDGWKGARSVGIGLSRIGVEAGATQGSEKRGKVHTASGGVSDHYEGNADSYAWDLMATGSTGTRAAKRIARALGVKNYRGGYWLNVTKKIEGRTFRFQLGWKVADHYDHVHLGVDREDIPG